MKHLKTTKIPSAPCCTFLHAHKKEIARVQKQMPPSETLLDLADLFKMFSDSTRIKILCALFRGELCVCDLAQLVGMGQSAVSHQLRLLRQSKLVKCRKEGKTVFYTLADEHVQTIFNQGLQHVTE